jgi:hypothetical protein
MKVIIPENRLEQLIFKYLDVKFKDLEQSKGGSHDIIFKIPGEEYGVLGWEKTGFLFIYGKIIDNIQSFIPLKYPETNNIIGRYVEDRYNLKVRFTPSYEPYKNMFR